MESAFADFDVSDFWQASDYATSAYVSPPPTDARIASIAHERGYTLPASYIELMKSQNGGIPRRRSCPIRERTTWAEAHVGVSGLFGIGREKRYALCGDVGSQFRIAEWGYPPIGVYVTDCPSAGHDMICLDYRKHGKAGEPEVVHVDQENAYTITFLAPDFATFIKGLVDDRHCE